MNKITDIELLEWAIKNAGNGDIDQKNNQTKFCESLKQSHQVVSNWKSRKRLPNGWRAYLLAQYRKEFE